MEESKIVKYILNECSKEESIQVQEWIEASSSNRELFQKLERTWIKSAAIPKIEVDTDQAWNTFKNRNIRSRSIFFNPYWVAAAAVLVIAMLFFIRNQSETNLLVLEANSTAQNVKLFDSSQVKLMKGQLSYPDKLKDKELRVKLEGTAFFEVQTQKNTKFIVEAKECSIEVLGTQFKVENLDSMISVSVLEGKVAFNTGNDGILLGTGEKASYNVNSKQFYEEKVSNEFFDLDKTIQLDNLSLLQVAQLLNEQYNSNIQVENDIKDLTINSTFKNESLETILTILSSTLNLEIDKTSSQIILKKKQ